jgi:hypothetical protein
MASRRRYLAPLGAAPSCPKPSYSRVLASTFAGDLAFLAAVLTGAGVGAGVAYFTDKGTDAAAKKKRMAMGAVIGGGAGFLGGIFPALYAQRATLRTANCPNPSLGSVFIYDMARYGVGGVAGAVAHRLGAKTDLAAPLISVGTMLALPPVGQAIIKTS